MKISIGKLVDGKQSVGWFGSQALRPGLALQIQRNIRVLNIAYEDYATQEKALYSKYGKETDVFYDKTGNEVEKEVEGGNVKQVIKILDENQDVFEDDLKALRETEIEISIQAIKFRDIENEQGLKIVPLVLLAAEWMFEFPDEEVEKPARKRHK